MVENEMGEKNAKENQSKDKTGPIISVFCLLG